jgi:excisionase family DNA binding protein
MFRYSPTEHWWNIEERAAHIARHLLDPRVHNQAMAIAQSPLHSPRPATPSFYTQTEAADRLGCAVSHVRRLAEQGSIASIPSAGGQLILYDAQDVDRLRQAASGSTPPPPAYTPIEAARRLGMTVDGVHELARRGQAAFSRSAGGRVVLFDGGDIDRLAARLRTQRAIEYLAGEQPSDEAPPTTDPPTSEAGLSGQGTT